MDFDEHIAKYNEAEVNFDSNLIDFQNKNYSYIDSLYFDFKYIMSLPEEYLDKTLMNNLMRKHISEDYGYGYYYNSNHNNSNKLLSLIREFNLKGILPDFDQIINFHNVANISTTSTQTTAVYYNAYKFSKDFVICKLVYELSKIPDDELNKNIMVLVLKNPELAKIAIRCFIMKLFIEHSASVKMMIALNTKTLKHCADKVRFFSSLKANNINEYFTWHESTLPTYYHSAYTNSSESHVNELQNFKKYAKSELEKIYSLDLNWINNFRNFIETKYDKSEYLVKVIDKEFNDNNSWIQGLFYDFKSSYNNSINMSIKLTINTIMYTGDKDVWAMPNI